MSANDARDAPTRPHTRRFSRSYPENLDGWNLLAEQREFELPVPICEQSDTVKLCETNCKSAIALQRISSALWGLRERVCPFIGSLLRHQSRCRSSRPRGRSPSNVADRISRPGVEPRAIPAIRLGAANPDIFLWSDCLEIGTGSSNSPRSAIESCSVCNSATE
jgi:hypothetical protein